MIGLQNTKFSCLCQNCTCTGCHDECFGDCHACGDPTTECNSYQTAGTKMLDTTSTSTAPAGFDYSGLDEQTVADLHLAEQMYAQGKKMTERGLRQMSDGVATAHDALCGGVFANCDNSKHGNRGDDSFKSWCESIGITKDTAYRLLQVTSLFDESSPRQQKVLQELSPSLLYAAAKPSAPPELVQKVKDGDITSHKQYQEALAQVKAERERANGLNEEVRQRDQTIHDLVERSEEADARAYKAEQRAKADADKINELVERNDELDYKLHITRTDLGGLMEQNQKLTAEKEKLLDERDEHIRTIRKLESRPVEVMAPDEEEVDRLAAERAVGLASARNAELADENTVLKGQINVLQGFINDSVQEDCEMAHHFVESTEAAFEAVIPVYLRLPSGDRNRLCWKLQDLLSHIQDATEVLLVGKDPRFAQDALDEDDEWEEDEI